MKRRSIRGGFTLVQLLGVIAITSVLMITSSRLLQITYRAQRDALSQLGQIERFSQVNQRLRSDAARATNCTAAAQLELLSNRQVVRYEQVGATLIRRWGPAGDDPLPETAQLPGEQHWQLPPGTVVSWDRDDSQQLPLLRCSVTFGNGERDDISWTYQLKGGDDGR